MGKKWVPFAGGAAAGALAGALYARYRADKQRAMTLLLAGSQLVDTACGRIEYATVGEGPEVLISPGGGGGYDQGLYLAALLRGYHFRCVAVSRPGYLRTPLSTGRTPEEQADAYAALLDVLHIDRVAVLAVSAGGPAALQFALRHPDRCWGLVLASAVDRPILLPRRVRWAQGLLTRSDFVPWLLHQAGERAVLAQNGIDGRLLARIRHDPETMGILRGILKGDVTSSLRRDGLLNDIEQVHNLPEYLLDDITVPVFAVHCPFDPVVPFAHGQFVARAVPGARLLAVEEGGHLCLVTHREVVVPRIVEFLERYAPAER